MKKVVGRCNDYYYKKKKLISAKLGTSNRWLDEINGTMWGESTKCISSIKTWLTNVDHHRVIEIYRNWLEYFRTGSIFVISSRYMGLKWPSSQINELGVVKRLKWHFLERIKCIGGCVWMYFAIITTGVLVLSLQDLIGISLSNHPHKRG